MKRSGVQIQDTINSKSINARNCRYHILTNRNRFFLNHVLIIVLEKAAGNIFRLVVYHDGQFLKDLVYYSLRGAKIAFIKYFKNRAYSEKVEAKWRETDGDLNELSPTLPQLTQLRLFQNSKKKV